ncbi:preprotein translocase subunit SecE [Candidatus Saccharibacteria bacterium]|nr:preprotein translocase subunit SecE [Candidatus Saccharibacteria bacterium]
MRKSAPTVRERQEAAQAKAETVKPRRVKRLTSKAAIPFKKLNLSDKKAVKLVAKPLRPVKKGLNWIVPRYFVNAWREVRQVVWPSRKETWRLTLAVFIFAVVFGALVAGVDKGLDEIFKKVVLK